MAKPTQDDIDYLVANPHQAQNFDTAFGQGASAHFLSNQSGGGSTLGRVASDIGKGITEAPGAVLRGAEEAVNQTSNAAKAAGDYLNENVADLGQIKFGHDQNGFHVSYDHGTPKENVLQVPDAVTPAAPESVTGNIVQGVSQFTTGMLGAGKFLKAFGVAGEASSALAKFATTAAKAGIADATVFDPHADRLSNLIQEAPYLRNPVTNFLAAKPEDGEALGRFKGALEGFLTGTALEGFVKSVKALKAAKGGDVKAAVDALHEPDAAPIETPKDTSATTEATPSATPNVAEQEAHALPEATAEVAPTAAQTAATQADQAAPERPGGTVKKTFTLSQDQLDQYRANLNTRYNDVNGAEARYGKGVDFNFDSMGGDEDVKAAINAMAGVSKDFVRKAVGGDDNGVRDWATVKQNADQIAEIVGGDPRLMVQNLSNIADHVHNLDAVIKSGGDFLLSITDHTDKLAQMLTAGEPGKYGSMEQLALHYNKATNLAANTYAMYKGIQTNVARGLNAAKITKSINPAFHEGMSKVDPEDLEAVIKMARRQSALNGLYGPEKAAATRKLIEGSMLDKAIGVHNEFWFNAVLSGIKTHVVNSTANALNAALYPAERMVGGLIGRNEAMFKEGAYQYAGMAKSFKDALKAASRAFEISDNVLDYRGPYAGIHKEFISADTFGLTKGDPLAPLLNGLGTTVRLPSRFLMAEDEFFKQLSYRGRVYAQAMRDGVGKGLKDADLAAHVEGQMDAAFSAEGHGLNESALQQAREATFTNTLDYGIGRWLESGVQQHPALRMIVPFVRVPTNIFRFIAQRTPGLGMLQKQMREDLAAGGERANMAYAKQATGAFLSASAVMSAYEGTITGYGPRDPDLRKQWLQDNQPYSFVIKGADGKKSFIAFNRIDPYSSFFGIAADMAYQMGQWDGDNTDQVAMGLAAAVAKNLASKTYLQGLTQTLDALQSKDPHVIQQWFQNRAASYVPNILNAADPDPYMREVRDIVDAMSNKVPGLSSTLPPSRDLLGEKMMTPMGYPWSAINPFTIKNTEGDPVKVELARLASNDDGAPFTLPSKRVGTLDLTTVKNKDGVSAWDRQQELLGDIRIGGKSLHDRLEHTIASEPYQNAADGNGEFKHSRKVDMIHRDIEHYRDIAQQKMLKEFPDLHKAMLNYKRQSNMVRAGRAPTNDPFAILKQ